jgi:meso-butanediol dehydrogenase/(S,S)-butanediol dehydrogenase/diacetyl reductase
MTQGEVRARFAGKRVLVTGAAGGVGAAVLAQFAAEGATVLGTDVTASGELVQADLSRPEEIPRLVTLTLDRLGGLDVLCNVAGIQQFTPVDQLTVEQLNRHLNINAVAPLLLTAALVPALAESTGNVVTVASIAAVMGQPYNTAYCASKAALLLGMRSLAVELAGRGVRVNCVSPGGVDTPLVQRAATSMPADVDWNLIGRSMGVLPGFATPDQVGSALLYLASDDAASITGTNLVVDRGTVW